MVGEHAPAPDKKPSITTVALIIVAVGAVAGYFAWSQFVKSPVNQAQQAAQGAVNTAQQAAKDAAKGGGGILGGLADAAKEGVKAIDPKDVVSAGADVLQGAGKIGTDVAHELVGLSVEEEWQVGTAIGDSLRGQLPISSDRAGQARLERLAKPILERLSRTAGRPYVISLVEEPVMNAFAVVGGNIFIYRGLLDEMSSDAAVQGVIAHEIGHVELAHCAKGSLAGIRAAQQAGDMAGAIASRLQGLIQVGYSEDQEHEADEFAYRMLGALGMSKADRLQFVRELEMFERTHGARAASGPPGTVGEAIGREIREHYRTHPPASDRVARLERLP